MNKIVLILMFIVAVFGLQGQDLTLGEAVALGVEYSDTLVQARETLRLTLIPIENSRFPATTTMSLTGGVGTAMIWGENVDFDADLTKQWPSVSLSTSFIEELSASISYQYEGAASFGVAWSPYDPSAIARRKKDKRSEELAKLVYTKALIDFEFNLKEQFVALYNQQRALEDSKAMIEIQKRQYQAALNRLEAGLVSAKEVDDLLSAQIAQEIQMFEDEQNFLTSQLEFSRFIGIEIMGRTLVAPDLDIDVETLVLPEKEELLNSLEERLDYQEALFSRDSALMDQGIARQWWVPNINLTGQVASPFLPEIDDLQLNKPVWDAAIGLTIGFDFTGATAGHLEAAEISVAQAERALDAAEYQLKVDIDQALYDHSVLLRRYELAKYSLELTEKELERVQFSFSQGEVFEDDVTVAQMEVQQDYQAVESKRFELYMSWLSLRRMAGYPVEELDG